jgi:hypothetical protein
MPRCTALDETDQQALRKALLALIGLISGAQDGTMVVPSEYLEIVILKR